MSMTREEKYLKHELVDFLGSQGYGTYARLFSLVDLNLTSDPKVIAFMEPNKGRIVMNRRLEDYQLSVIIRHEILHEYLKHEKRLLAKLARDYGLEDELSDATILDLKKILYSTQDFNIAADYEISNLAYTDDDKEIVRNLHALVTEDQHADWINYSVEDMYDELQQIRKREQQKARRLLKDICVGQLLDDTTFVDIEGNVYGI